MLNIYYRLAVIVSFVGLEQLAVKFVKLEMKELDKIKLRIGYGQI